MSTGTAVNERKKNLNFQHVNTPRGKIGIRVSIKIESRFRIGIKTMRIHNASNSFIVVIYLQRRPRERPQIVEGEKYRKLGLYMAKMHMSFPL